MTKKEFFTRFPLLNSIPENNKQQLYRHFSSAPEWVIENCTQERLSSDTVFIREGDLVHSIYFIADGIFSAVDYRVIGFEYEFAQFTNVHAMGGMEVIMDLHSYRTTLKTIEQCKAIKMSKRVYEKWIMTDIQAMRYESKMMGEYLLEQGRLAREYLFLPGAVRLAKIFVRKYEQYAQNNFYVCKMSRQNMSNVTGFSIKTVSRSLKTLQNAKLITKGEKYIEVDFEQYLGLKQMVDAIVIPSTDDQDIF